MLQIGTGKEILERRGDSFPGINLSVLEARLKIFGRQVDVDDLIRFGQDRIWNPLADFDADERFNRVVQAFEMLNVQGRKNVDSRGENILNILIAFGISTAGNIGVCKFVDDYDL